MKTFKLTGPDFLHPMWFNRVRHGQHSALVGENGIVTLDGEQLQISGETPLPGSVIEVWLNMDGFFVGATAAELKRVAEERRATEEAKKERHRAHLNTMRSEAESFNERICLPVKWDVGIKDVLSGLSEKSSGDGRNKATVEHIYLLEPLTLGRIVRDKGDFLCSASSRSNGKRWSSTVLEHALDGDGKAYQPKVTCKRCMDLAKRWMNERT